MILTVLGANGPYPSKMGACSGYLLTSDSGNTRILFDCGSGVLGRLLNECDITDLSCAVLTHLHFDHMSDMLPMHYSVAFSGMDGLKVICPQKPEAVYKLLQGGTFDLYDVNDTTIGEMKLEFLPVNHPVETYAVRVYCDGAVFVYTGDTNQTDALTLFADNADLLLADAGLLSRDWAPKKPHMSAAMCASLAKDAKVKSLVLTHISPAYDPQALLDEAKPIYQNVTLAQSGQRIVI